MPDTLKLQSEPVTQAMFDRLPALLTAYQVKLVTGYNDGELADAVADKRIAAVKRKPRAGRKKSYSKYTKISVGKLVGYTI